MTTEPCPGSGQSYLRDKASITVKCEWCDKEMHPKNRIGYLRPHKRPIVADSSDRQLGIYIAKESCPLFSSSRVEPKLSTATSRSAPTPSAVTAARRIASWIVA